MKQLLSILGIALGFRVIYLLFKKETWVGISYKETWQPILEHLEWTFKFYSFTLTIPLIASIYYIAMAILGVLNSKVSFIEIWIGYFATGELMGIVAWRWQLFLFIVANAIVLLSKLDKKL